MAATNTANDLMFTERVYVNPKGLLRLKLAAGKADDKRFPGKAYRIDTKQREKDGQTYDAKIVTVRFEVVDVLDKPANKDKFVGQMVTTVVDLEMGRDNGTRKLAKAILGAEYTQDGAKASLAARLRDANGEFTAMVSEDVKPDGRKFPKVLLDTAEPVDAE